MVESNRHLQKDQPPLTRKVIAVCSKRHIMRMRMIDCQARGWWWLTFFFFPPCCCCCPFGWRCSGWAGNAPCISRDDDEAISSTLLRKRLLPLLLLLLLLLLLPCTWCVTIMHKVDWSKRSIRWWCWPLLLFLPLILETWHILFCIALRVYGCIDIKYNKEGIIFRNQKFDIAKRLDLR